MNTKVRKIIGVILVLIFINIPFLFFFKEAYRISTNLITIILFNIFVCLDIVIRPISEKRDQYKFSILTLSFLLLPFIVTFPFYENKLLISKYLATLNRKWISYTGIGILILGGSILIYSRIKLGKYGGPKIVIEDEHKFISNGIYRYIRHPMYLGYLLLFFGYSLSFCSFISTFLTLIFLFIIFKSRMDLEEKLLTSKFGEDYISYLNKTYRLIPKLY